MTFVAPRRVSVDWRQSLRRHSGATDLGFTRDRHSKLCPSRLQPTWVRKRGSPESITTGCAYGFRTRATQVGCSRLGQFGRRSRVNPRSVARPGMTADGSTPAETGLGGTMFDIIIRGGDVVTPQGAVRCDVAIAGETIAAIAAAGALSTASANRVIDATGHIVMPGGIDPHVHLHHVWIKPDGTPLITAGPEQVGRAALFGGTTTFIDFAYWRDGASALQAIELRDKDFVGKSPCDWAYHIMLHSEPPPEFAGELAEAIQAGYPTLKIFTTNIL